MKIAGIEPLSETILIAAIADGTRTTAWLQSKDGAIGENRPKSLLAMMMGEESQENKDIRTFASGEEFDREWQRLTGGGN